MARIRPSVFFRGSTRPTNKINSPSPNRSRKSAAQAPRNLLRTPFGTTAIRSGFTPKRAESCRASACELGKTRSQSASSSRLQPGSLGQSRRSDQADRLPTLRAQRRSRFHKAPGWNQQIGERTTGVPWALARLASSKPSRDIPKRWSRRARSSRSVQGQKRRTGRPIDLEVTGRLDELVLSPSGGLERE